MRNGGAVRGYFLTSSNRSTTESMRWALALFAQIPRFLGLQHTRLFGQARRVSARPSALVDPAWVLRRMPHVSILDASWYMPKLNRDPNTEFIDERIPEGARRFDIDGPGLADLNSDLPHMLPSPEDFTDAVTKLGIRRNVPVVIYAKKGFVGAARAWWMFRVFGKNDVFLLNGGLESWKAEGHEVATGPPAPTMEPLIETETPMVATKNEQLVKSMQDMHTLIKENSGVIIDARSKGRFEGTAPEPREGLMGGHMPGSFSQPCDQLTSADGKLLSVSELRTVLAENGIDNSILTKSPIALTCGSGVTAAIDCVALYELGFDAAVYDGSWSEYGSHHENPVNKK
ncbi:3-mercaptopyruvate sulfurtransferase [Chondrus crispus]|uniref:Sulfurtransferase n=1 Tax=Chondrus crispus TaxID=2769 RepID=R7Q4K2_CHOCR|nr:3-mercaptopyruvate sulfurtransferase [Chondrus crispus]CDF32390.1 3-mercaptopyruvate sulfurtransferase [Chondrus crispus]|eukprot:XP_005712055.1 3-mercaptopyruvate sulfurtransferase [Chondrus crispus]